MKKGLWQNGHLRLQVEVDHWLILGIIIKNVKEKLELLFMKMVTCMEEENG